MTEREALKLALEALHGFIPYLPLNDEAQCGRYDEALTAIKEALAQLEQPKVRTGNCLRVGVCASEGHKIAPQRTWVGLEDDDEIDWDGGDIKSFVRAIEAKLKEKNT